MQHRRTLLTTILALALGAGLSTTAHATTLSVNITMTGGIWGNATLTGTYNTVTGHEHFHVFETANSYDYDFIGTGDLTLPSQDPQICGPLGCTDPFPATLHVTFPIAGLADGEFEDDLRPFGGLGTTTVAATPIPASAPLLLTALLGLGWLLPRRPAAAKSASV